MQRWRKQLSVTATAAAAATRASWIITRRIALPLLRSVHCTQAGKSTKEVMETAAYSAVIDTAASAAVDSIVNHQHALLLLSSIDVNHEANSLQLTISVLSCDFKVQHDQQQLMQLLQHYSDSGAAVDVLMMHRLPLQLYSNSIRQAMQRQGYAMIRVDVVDSAAATAAAADIVSVVCYHIHSFSSSSVLSDNGIVTVLLHARNHSGHALIVGCYDRPMTAAAVVLKTARSVHLCAAVASRQQQHQQQHGCVPPALLLLYGKQQQLPLFAKYSSTRTATTPSAVTSVVEQQIFYQSMPSAAAR